MPPDWLSYRLLSKWPVPRLPAAQARLLCVLAAGPRRMSELTGLPGIEKAPLTRLADQAD